MNFVNFILLIFFVGNVLGHLPEQDMDVPELISYYGYPVETITTETVDGYFLVLHRIPFGRNLSQNLLEPRPVIFLQHGLLGSSADWCSNIPSQSAAYVFADSGFDVWMGNIRGNVYSSKHRSLSRYSTKFWNFTFDEHASLDLSTMVQTVLNITKQDKLYYVGHSQGTAIMFAKASEDEEFSKKISGFFALAPVTTVAHIRGLMGYLGSRFVSKFGKIVDVFGAYDFLPSGFFQKIFSYMICGTRMSPLCDNILFQIAGPDSKDINMTRVMVYVDHTPAGTSTKNIIHWAQMVSSKKFRKYDYGSQNEEYYGQSSPPEYNISNIKIPTSIFYSKNDWLADPEDVQKSIVEKMQTDILKKSNDMGIYNHLGRILWKRFRN
ncbi:hypothetical protein FO519_005549 [Halicephalobus sp. NKZ332]|nr:hypothetical protein FO519_005549 [Halicephalobus sp. NKZ332]